MTPEETAEAIMDQVWIHTDSGMHFDGGAAINLIAQAIRDERDARQKAEAVRIEERLRSLCGAAAQALQERCICDECGEHEVPVCDGCLLARRLEKASK